MDLRASLFFFCGERDAREACAACRTVVEFWDEILVFFIIVCGMVVISYKIFCLYGHS